MKNFKRLPEHIGVIPDGNRRWAVAQGMDKQDGYEHGIDPGFQLYEMCLDLGIKELTFYGFTQDNTKRPKQQTIAFQKACVDAVESLAHKDAELFVIGNTSSPLFPKELLPYTTPVKFGEGKIRINFLVNYGWNWDLNYALDKLEQSPDGLGKQMMKNIASSGISRVDLIVRWGGRRRLSGFLPVQSIYSDFYIVEDYWPDFQPEHFYHALDWYQSQDITLGG